MLKITGKTSVYGIIGSPVAHSLSPLMHNAGFKAVSLDAVYVPYQVSTVDLGAAVKGLSALGVAGFNVTIPHKSDIMKHLDEISPEAEIAGAVNTVVSSAGRLIGYNTDGSGLLISLGRDLAFNPEGKQIVLLGAGGASRGAAAALATAGVASIAFFNRTLDRATLLAGELRKKFVSVNFEVPQEEDLPALFQTADLIVNATSIGLKGEDFTGLPLALLKNSAKVYDMVYSQSGTPLCCAASLNGIESAGGLGMLVAQGELAFELWTGIVPPEGLFASSVGQNIRLSKS